MPGPSLSGLVGLTAIPAFDTTITVTRRDPGTFVKGRYVDDPTPTVFDIDAAVQPVGPDELQDLEEGRRTGAAIDIFATVLLRTADAPGGFQPDLVDYRGESYQVDDVDDWEEQGGYFRARALKVGQ